LTNLRAK